VTLTIIIIFILGYLAIALEHVIKLNKAASALLTGVLCWVIYILNMPNQQLVNEQLTGYLGDLAGILFFLLSAMTIVELIDAHGGFSVVTERITRRKKRSLIWVVGFITFFLSAVLDNLTTAIVMISLLRKLIKGKEDRLYFAGIVVIAANAGGAWSPIGDVTTTMLWIGEQITAFSIIVKLIIPSIVSLVIPLLLISFRLKGETELPDVVLNDIKPELQRKQQKIILFSGIAVLLFVPVFKTITGLPPYMGILLGLGIIWIITQILHTKKSESESRYLSVSGALRRIDSSTILFFLGILLAISALQSAGVLFRMAEMLDKVRNINITVMLIGLFSSIVDNVLLVAAVQGMYDLIEYPVNHYFWTFLAYTTGTGGSALIIGSAAGVAAMGIEKIDFFWYLKNITWLALAGFFSGAIVYILQEAVLK
jgi:Na+/H+ antiporter NhaD/arsenite permease-like protein